MSFLSFVVKALRILLVLLTLAPMLPGADARGGRGVVVPASAAPAPGFTVETGEIAGAKYTALIPRSWNHRILLLAHGLRDAETPLVADLNPDALAYRTLVDEGWIVAKTSYRRNGIIVADAIADLDALRAELIKSRGEPSRVLVEGDSMGGMIATLLAEREPDSVQGGRMFDGAVAVDPAFALRSNSETLGVTGRPSIPLVFVANQSELAASQAYVTISIPSSPDRRPLVFRIARDGHVNVNQRERLAALRTLNLWIDSGRAVLPTPKLGEQSVDATIAAERVPTLVTMQADGRGFDARVLQVTTRYGNVYVNVQPDDFIAAGIKALSWFQLKVGDRAYRIRYGSYFDSVAAGEWVAFGSADGFTWIGRNNANAGEAAGLKVGDTVTFRALDSLK